MNPRWKSAVYAAVILIIVLAGLTVLGFLRQGEAGKTDEAVRRINARKVTMADVMGENLPPKPNQQLNDSTVAGIDANNNGVRDDVELAIFEKYPNSAKIRAVMLQYAQALQLELTEVFNSETLIKILQKRGYGQACIDEAVLSQKSYSINNDVVKEVESFVLNTDMRKERQTDIFNKYMTVYSIPARQQCELDLSSLPN